VHRKGPAKGCAGIAVYLSTGSSRHHRHLNTINLHNITSSSGTSKCRHEDSSLDGANSRDTGSNLDMANSRDTDNHSNPDTVNSRDTDNHSNPDTDSSRDTDNHSNLTDSSSNGGNLIRISRLRTDSITTDNKRKARPA
jgi:hypothetical protein